MNITEKEVKSLKPYKNNPRHNEKSVDLVANSIKEFGFKQPIVIDGDNVIVAGHTRYLAAIKLGIEAVPCVIASDLTPEQITAYRLADNKTSELSSWDNALLGKELENIFDIDMEAFGFDSLLQKKEVELKEIELTPYKKVHYLISCDVALHDTILPLIDQLRARGGVGVESTLN